MTTVAELTATFGIKPDHGSFQRADHSLKGLLTHANHAVHALAGVWAVHKIIHWAEEWVNSGVAVAHASQRIGIATGALQELDFAAGQSGASTEQLETGLRFLARSSYAASQGTKASADVFAKLGIHVKDANGEIRSTDDLLPEVADKLSGLTSDTERTALAVKLFGRGGASLIPLLLRGSEGIAELRQEARDLGGGLDPEFIQNSLEVEESLKKLKFQSLGLISGLGNLLFPLIERGVLAMINFGKAIRGVLKDTEGVKYILGVTAAALAAWGAIAIATASEAIAAWFAAAAPFLIAAAGIVAIGLALDDVHQLLTGGKSLIGQYLDKWFGAGTAARFVEDWRNGVKSLSDALDYLIKLSYADFVKGLADGFETLVKATWDWLDPLGRITKVLDAIKRGDWGEALKAGLEPFTVGVEAGAKARQGADALVDSGYKQPLAAGRGISAPTAGFGQALPSTAALQAAGAVTKGGPHGRSLGHSISQNNEVNVTVNASTGADPKEIAHHAGRVVDERLSRQNRNLRDALVNTEPDEGEGE